MRALILAFALLAACGRNEASGGSGSSEYHWQVSGWKAHYSGHFWIWEFQVDAPAGSVDGVAVPPFSAHCQNYAAMEPGTRNECAWRGSQPAGWATAAKVVVQSLVSSRQDALNRTFMVTYEFRSPDDQKTYDVTGVGDGVLSDREPVKPDFSISGIALKKAE